MLQPIIELLKARKDRKNLLKRVEALEFALEQHLLQSGDESLTALDLLQRVEAKLDGRKGGRPKKDTESENNISTSVILKPDGNPL